MVNDEHENRSADGRELELGPKGHLLRRSTRESDAHVV